MPPAIARTELDLGHLYRTHITMVRQRCLRILGAQAMAKDIAQDVFVSFAETYGSKPPERSGALLYAMATHRALNALRDGRRRNEILAQNASTEVEIPNELGVDLRRALAALDPELAAIGTYTYVDGMEQDEIAEVLGLHRRTVSRRLEAFRVEARALLGGQR